MNRKDTIMMAVVVNAVLLTALFVSAIRKTPAEPVLEAQPVAIVEPKEEKVIKVASGDAIDEALKDFSEQAKEAPVQKTTSKIDFAKELEAITKAAVQKTEKTAPPPARRDGMLEVTVVSGDSLAKLASRHGTTVEAISTANQLKTTVLQIGQKLQIPSKGTAQKTSSEDSYYIVKQGDNPWTIAVKNQIKVDELLRLNNLNEEKARRLRPGDRLRIR